MKKLIILPLLLLSLTLGATTYYVKNGGSDVAAGTSDATAWATLSKVQSSTFSAGDSIFFRRGDTFRGGLDLTLSGSVDNRITFDAYGTGNKPKIWGSDDWSSSALWSTAGADLWTTTGAVNRYPISPIQAANIIFNNGASCGAKKAASASCVAQGDWYINPTTGIVTMYSTSNPGTFYTHIEIGGIYIYSGFEEVILLDNCDYVTIRNLDIRHSGNNAIVTKNGSTNIIIEHNDVSFAGGMYVWGDTSERMGNGIGIWKDASDITIRYNKVHDCYDAGISPQGSGTYTQSDIIMHHNIIDRCYWSYETWTPTGCTSTNVHFINNTCLNAGDQWSQSQRPDATQPWHIKIGHDEGTVINCTIQNNIIYSASGLALRFGYSITKYLSDYNLYYDNTNLAYGYPLGSFATLAAWQAAQATHDQNSVSGNPLLKSEYTGRVKEDSPAIDAGVDVGLDYDFYGHKITGTPDIGAMEYGKYIMKIKE